MGLTKLRVAILQVCAYSPGNVWSLGLTYILRKMTNLFRTVKGCKTVSYDNELGMFTQEKRKRPSARDLVINAHSTFICISLRLETTQSCISWKWTNQLRSLHPHGGAQLRTHSADKSQQLRCVKGAGQKRLLST